MPSLHNFDTCWGNRRYFYDVYCDFSQYDWLNDHEASLTVSSSSRGFTSSNGYYGYQPIVEVPTPCEPALSMEIETPDHRISIDSRDSQSRKRPSSNSSDLLDSNSKRVKTDTGGW